MRDTQPHATLPAKRRLSGWKALCAAAALALTTAPAGAQSAPVYSGYTYVDSTGRVVTVDRQGRIVPNGYDATVTYRGPNYGGTRDTSVRRTAPGQFGYSSQFRGDRGAFTQSSGIVSCDGAGQCFRDGVYIGPRGGVTSTRATNGFGPGGSYNGFATTTGPRGGVYTRDAESFRTPDGRAGVVRRDGPYGQSVRQFERVRQPGGYIGNSTFQGPRGQVFDRRADVQCFGGSCSRNVVRTGPDGRQTRVDVQSRRVAPGVREGTRTWTDRRGRQRTRDWRWERRR